MACVVAPVLFLAGEVALIRIYMYEMFKIDHNIWDDFLLLRHLRSF